MGKRREGQKEEERRENNSQCRRGVTEIGSRAKERSVEMKGRNRIE